MSIAILGQVYDEVKRLSIAGSVVAPGDFRLKKLVPALEQVGAKAPVFAKVAEAANALLHSNEHSSAEALLDLSTLVNAILYTQGQTGVEGVLAPIRSSHFGLSTTETSARMLKPLLEALSTEGSGRMEMIRDAERRGAFQDLRLIRPSLLALDDRYREIADLIAEKVIPKYGAAIVPELQAQFNPKGSAGHARRLRLIHQLDPGGSRPYIKQALEEGTKEIRIAAIGCLGAEPEDLLFLLDQAKSKSKEIRLAALHGLSACESDAAVEILCVAIEGNDLSSAVSAIRACRQPGVLSFLWQRTTSHFQKLVSSETEDAKKVGRDMERMLSLLDCLDNRQDADAETMLASFFAERNRLMAIKAEPSGLAVLEKLSSIMVQGSQKLQRTLAAQHDSLPLVCIGHAFVAACQSHTASEVYSLFSPYFDLATQTKKRGKNPQTIKREAIAAEIMQRYGSHLDDLPGVEGIALPPLDRRWLDLAISIDLREMVYALATADHPQVGAVLLEWFESILGKEKEFQQLVAVLRTMVRIRHPAATDSIIATLTQKSKFHGSHLGYWVGRLIPCLPKAEALPKLQAIVPTLPSKVSDHLIEFVTELKDQP